MLWKLRMEPGWDISQLCPCWAWDRVTSPTWVPAQLPLCSQEVWELHLVLRQVRGVGGMNYLLHPAVAVKADRDNQLVCGHLCHSVPSQLPHSCCLLSQLMGTWCLPPALLACPQSSATSCLFRAIQVPTSSSNKGRACAKGRCSPACPPAVPLTHSPALPTLRSSQKMLV